MVKDKKKFREGSVLLFSVAGKVEYCLLVKIGLKETKMFCVDINKKTHKFDTDLTDELQYSHYKLVIY